jgi:O-methyltransferase
MTVQSPATHGAQEQLAELYLDLLKKCLTRYAMGENSVRHEFPKGTLRRTLFAPIKRALSSRGIELVRATPFDPASRAEGKDWPRDAETMIGLKRLDNIQACVTDVVRRGVPGDLIETGVWRGGASIFMRAVLKAHGDTTRTVWAADSFQGLPKPQEEQYPADRGDALWSFPELAVSKEQVQANFAKYGLLDDQVRFLVGWFRDTLPNAPMKQLAVMRLDGDLYESTMDALNGLYSKLSIGGYVIVDDYGVIPACKQAVEDFRQRIGITEPLVTIDWSGVYWQRQR